MEQLKINQHQKEGIISEYLLGGITYRKLAEKHNMDFRKIIIGLLNLPIDQ